MKKVISSIIILILFSISSEGADECQVGDKLYIWAKNGPNLRLGTGTNSKVITKLGFGEEVYILEITEISYNVMGIPGTKPSYYSKKVDPIIFKGRWVKVRTASGLEGYLIDQYLLSLPPKESVLNEASDINLQLLSTDTIYLSPIIHDGEGLNMIVERNFGYGIKVRDSSGGFWAEAIYILPNFSIEEAMILLSSSMNDYENYIVIKNWKEEIILFDNGICEMRFSMVENDVRVNISCSC